jgi:hypothetical protein
VTQQFEPDDLDQELEDLLRAQALAGRLVEVLSAEVFGPARELFGPRAATWVAGTLRTTAELLERMGDGGRLGA